MKFIYSISVLHALDDSKTNDFHITAVGGQEDGKDVPSRARRSEAILGYVGRSRPAAPQQVWSLMYHSLQSIEELLPLLSALRYNFLPHLPFQSEAHITIHSCMYNVSVALNHSCDLTHFKLCYIPPRFATPSIKTTTSVEDSGSFNLYFH